MIKVGIVGASGYTGAELVRILSYHPQVELTAVTSRQYHGQKLSSVFPQLRTICELRCEDLKGKDLADRADLFFTAVPHSSAMNLVPALLDAGKKVVDLSADFRLRNQDTYEQWYQSHSAGHLLGQAVYGLPELYRQKIKGADLVANPGCYPTSIILGLTPLLNNGAIRTDSIIADSKSGTSGAGRAAQTGTMFCEVHDGFRPYKVGRAHRHIPEIEQELSFLAATPVNISFTPHLLPVSRGILSTIYCSLTDSFDYKTVSGFFQDQFADEHFVRLLAEDEFPATQQVRGSNYCDLSFKLDPVSNRIIVMSAIDNIVKGASGQAVQNMNLMCGFAEQTGLTTPPVFP